MPRNGSGVYSKVTGTTAVSGEVISSADYNAQMDDLASDANTPRPIVAGGTGVTTESAFRAAYGLRVGTDVQAYDVALQSISDLTLAAATGIYATNATTFATYPLTIYARGLAASADQAAYHTALGLGDVVTRSMSFDADPAADGTAISPRYLSKIYMDAIPAVLGILEDQRSSGVAPQTITASTWNTRNINTQVYDGDGYVTISANTFTVTVDCWCEWSAPGRGAFQTRLYNVTNTVVAGVGTSITQEGNNVGTSTGGALLGAGKTYRIEQNANATLPGGAASSFGTEIYARVKLLRVPN